MEFEEIFENKRKQYGNYSERRYHDEDQYSYNKHHSYPGFDNRQKWLTILDKVRNNNKLKVIVLLAVILITSIAILLIIVFMPLIIKLFNDVGQNGLQGILDSITGFLDKIWKGFAK